MMSLGSFYNQMLHGAGLEEATQSETRKAHILLGAVLSICAMQIVRYFVNPE